jgi:hypothetical protein
MKAIINTEVAVNKVGIINGQPSTRHRIYNVPTLKISNESTKYPEAEQARHPEHLIGAYQSNAKAGTC